MWGQRSQGGSRRYQVRQGSNQPQKSAPRVRPPLNLEIQLSPYPTPIRRFVRIVMIHFPTPDGTRLRELLVEPSALCMLRSIHSVHLRSETGIAIPDEVGSSWKFPIEDGGLFSLEDSLAGYVGYGGLIYVVDGSTPSDSNS